MEERAEAVAVRSEVEPDQREHRHGEPSAGAPAGRVLHRAQYDGGEADCHGNATRPATSVPPYSANASKYPPLLKVSTAAAFPAAFQRRAAAGCRATTASAAASPLRTQSGMPTPRYTASANASPRSGPRHAARSPPRGRGVRSCT